MFTPQSSFCSFSSQKCIFCLMRFRVFLSVFSPCTCIIVLLCYMIMQRLCSGISHCKSAGSLRLFCLCLSSRFSQLCFHAHVLLSTDGCWATTLGALTAAVCWIYATGGQRPLRYGSINARDICELGLEHVIESSSCDKRWLLCNRYFFFFNFLS